MPTKPKAPAKSPASAKKSAKAPAKSAARPVAKAASHKPAVKSAAKPAVKSAASKAPAAKSGAKKPVEAKAAKSGKPVAGKGVPLKTTPAPRLAPVKAGAKPNNKPPPSAQTLNPVAGGTGVYMPPPKPTPRPSPVVSQKDLASAHEYLLTRTAGRSEAPVIVNGKPLPTEGQLLAMPDSAYMNADQLAFFRHRLQELERELLTNADETTEHLRETVIVPDPADRATIEEEHALELRTRDRERKLLKKVQASLQQIESGEYGFCEETGDPIGIPRLLARPTASLSLEAQQRREIKQKMFGD
jgi:DnaK suppressor protein